MSAKMRVKTSPLTYAATPRRGAAAVACAAVLAAAVLAAAAPAGPAAAQAAPADMLRAAEAAMTAEQPREALRLYEEALAAAPGDRDATLGRALALAELGRLDEAIAIYDALLEDRPRDATARFYRGVARYTSGALDGAIQDLNAAIAGGARFARVFQRLGDAYYAKGDAASALESYRLAAELPDHLPAVRRGMGNAYYALGDYAAAREAYGAALAADPRDGRAALYRGWAHERLGDLDAALADYDRALSALPERSAELYVSRGDLLRAQGDLRRALADYRAAIELEPTLATATFGLAVALLDQNQINEALYFFDQLVAQVGETERLGAAALRERGRARLMSGAYEQAESDLTQSLRLSPDVADAHYNRALARIGVDDLAGAMEDLTRATAIAPDDADAHYALARAAAAANLSDVALSAAEAAESLVGAGAAAGPDPRLGRGLMVLAFERPEEAIAVFDDVLRDRPRDIGALRAKTRALMKLERHREALTLAQALAEAAPGDPSGHLYQAEALIPLRRPEAARAALDRANKLGATPVEVARLAGRAWLSEGRRAQDAVALARARDAFDAAMRFSGDDLDDLALRAEALTELGELDAAKRDLDRAIGASPQNPRHRFARATVLKRLDRCGEAIRDYDVGLSLRPDNSEARAARGRCKFAEGAYLGSVSDWIGSWF